MIDFILIATLAIASIVFVLFLDCLKGK